MRRTSVIAALALVTLSGCSATRTPASPDPVAAPLSPALPPVPAGGTSTGSDIQFVLRDYTAGETARVRIENVGDRAYRYQALYAACVLHYVDDTGRRFIIPPGTHCDIISYATIDPGETKVLFKWDLDACVKDQWGCVRSKPLAPGTYTITGAFKPVNSGHAAHASGSFELLPSS